MLLTRWLVYSVLFRVYFSPTILPTIITLRKSLGLLGSTSQLAIWLTVCNRLHWRIWGGRRPPIRKDCCSIERKIKQVWCHLPTIQCPHWRYRKVGHQPLTFPSVRFHHSYNLCWYFGSRGSAKKACCWKSFGIRLLKRKSVALHVKLKLSCNLLGSDHIIWTMHSEKAIYSSCMWIDDY
jgi:hypothetical protein